MTYRANPLTFEITEEHLKLLRRMYVGWQECEYGAPEIDPKRPYGNSDVMDDLIEIIHGHTGRHEDGTYSVDEAEQGRLHELHHDTETVLAIILRSGRMEPGVYRRSETWKLDWKREEANDAR